MDYLQEALLVAYTCLGKELPGLRIGEIFLRYDAPEDFVEWQFRGFSGKVTSEICKGPIERLVALIADRFNGIVPNPDFEYVIDYSIKSPDVSQHYLIQGVTFDELREKAPAVVVGMICSLSVREKLKSA